PKVISSFDDPPGRSGWIVIQCRKTGQLDFITESYLYNIGFGDPNNEYWIGCEKLHKITNNQRHELYIELADSTGRQFFARNLNGNYNITNANLIPEGFWWGELYSLKYCKMSIRPNME
ncbi:hypothetical protein M5D96_009247, partial [Drosophila gunungcola]